MSLLNDAKLRTGNVLSKFSFEIYPTQSRHGKFRCRVRAARDLQAPWRYPWHDAYGETPWQAAEKAIKLLVAKIGVIKKRKGNGHVVDMGAPLSPAEVKEIEAFLIEEGV